MRGVLGPIAGLSALLAALAALASACTPSAEAETGRVAGVWVRVAPNAASAGSPVDLRADCRDGNTSALVKSDAFSPVTLAPDGDTLAGVAQIARRTPEGTYHAILTCPSGARARAPLAVVGRGGSTVRPVDPDRVTIGPHTGGGFLARNPPPVEAEPASQRRTGGWVTGAVAVIVGLGVLFAVRGRRRPRR